VEHGDGPVHGQCRSAPPDRPALPARWRPRFQRRHRHHEMARWKR
jgi:hypothetical protein